MIFGRNCCRRALFNGDNGDTNTAASLYFSAAVNVEFYIDFIVRSGLLYILIIQFL